MNLIPDNAHTSFFLTGPARAVFEKCLKLEGIPPKSHSFYTYRANQFIKSANGLDPINLGVAEITEILGRFGRDDNLADWQFGQLVDAVRILLSKCSVSPAAKDIDWAYWKASARSVSGDHATTAREFSPDELVYLKVSRGEGKYVEIRQQHRDLIIRFVTEIRARGYAYRTEEAYEQWIVRYIAFCKGVAPEKTGAGHVAEYLHDLVISGNVSASGSRG